MVALSNLLISETDAVFFARLAMAPVHKIRLPEL